MKWILPKSVLASSLFLISTHASALKVTKPALMLAQGNGDAIQAPVLNPALTTKPAATSTSTPAPATQTLYDLDSAKKFHTDVSGNYYIQLGCFENKANAEKLLADVKFRTDDPVTLAEKNGHFIVTLGPYHSADDVRGISEILGLFLKSKTQGPCPKATETAAPVNQEPVKDKTVTETPIKTTVAKTEKTEPVTVEPKKFKKHKPHQFVYHAHYKDNAYVHIKLIQAHGAWYIAGDLGVWAPLVDNTMTVNNGTGFPAPADLDSYSTNTRWGGTIGLGGGYRWARDERWLPAVSVGLRYEHLFATNIGQQITQFSAPEFTNYNYTLNIASDVLLFATKINLVQIGQFSPFINGGVGISFNRVSNYSETPLADVTARDGAGFANNSSHGFAYSIGAGLDWQVQSQLIMSLNYEFQGLGSINTKSGVNTWSATHLHSGTYQSNNVLLTMSYLFDKQTA
jgi:opacity protein-like surface antigen